MKNLWVNYRDWLIKYCGFKLKGYNLLMDQLHNSPFEVVLDRDINRLKDGESLRQQFLMKNGINGDFYEHNVGVLEVLVALAVRIDCDFIGNPNNPHPENMFWEMICNLGLDKFDDKHYNSDAVYNILGVWIGRKFDKNGFGSVFPLPKTYTDQRKIELWRQMTAYVNIHFCM